MIPEETTQEMRDRHEDEAVSIAVISTQLEGFKDLMLEKLSKQDSVLGAIKEQTIKTNGHVADAFREIDALKESKNKVVGALVIINIIIIPILLLIIKKYLHV